MIKVITKKEAMDWLTATNSEDTLVLSKYTPDLGDVIYSFISTLSESECSDDCPEGMQIYYYGTSGWDITEPEFEERKGTIIDKLVEEHGYRCGDIYIHEGCDIIENYVDYVTERFDDAVYILGLDSDIQQILPCLTEDRQEFPFLYRWGMNCPKGGKIMSNKAYKRRWNYPQCGEHNDRDINAAINIRNEGYKIYQAA